MKVNIGGKAYPGWKSLDWYHAADIKQDLRLMKPFPFDEAEEFHSSHVLEHLSDQAAQFTIDECYRTLIPGGSLRISVPCATKTWEAYKANDHSFFDDGEALIIGPNIGKKFLNMFVSLKRGGPVVTDEQVAERCKSIDDMESFVQWGISLILPTTPYVAHRNWYTAEKLDRMLHRFDRIKFGGEHELDKYPIISLRVTAWKEV